MCTFGYNSVEYCGATPTQEFKMKFNTTFGIIFVFSNLKFQEMNLFYSFVTSIVLAIMVNGDVPYDAIDQAFETNNASEIVSMGKDKILVNVLGKEGVYSQPQASLVLKDFFTKKPGNSFDFYFKGKESSEGTFAIGNYESRGEKFRVTIHFKKIGSSYKIESLTIEKA